MQEVHYICIAFVQGKNKNTPDAKAQAAIISGVGGRHQFPASGTDQIRNLDRSDLRLDKKTYDWQNIIRIAGQT